MTLLKNISLLVIFFCYACSGAKNDYMSMENFLKGDIDHELYSYNKDDYDKNETNLVSTLTYYGVQVKMSASNEILVPKGYLSDKDFLWNMYRKATNPSWRQQHLESKN